MSNPNNHNRGYDPRYDEQTRQFNPNHGGYPQQRGGYQQGQGYPQGQQVYHGGPGGYGGPGGHGGQGGHGGHGGSNQNWGQPRKSGLIAGRFEAKKVIINLIVLGVLSAAVTFAAVFIVDLIISQFAGYSSGGVGTAIVVGVIAGLVGVLAGLLYIPVVGTGNEHLYGLAIIALAVVAAVVWVLFGGLLDGDWSTLITLTGIIATAMTAYATRPRIEAADVRMPR
ncbi:hypothetical protein [Corynebacterium urogenitale]